QRAERSEERLAIGDVLDDFEGEGDVEALARGGDLLDAGGTVVDGKSPGLGVGAGDFDRRPGGVDTGHGKAEPGHRLGHEAAATADVDQPQTLEGPHGFGVAAKGREQLPADEIETGGVYPMKGAKAALGVPPGRALRGEAIDVARVYGVAEFTHAAGIPRSDGR